MILVSFDNVGRNNETWEETFDEVSDDDLLRAIRRKASIMSADLSIHWYARKKIDGVRPESTTAEIVVGGFRGIGTLTIKEA